jgi:hypothetical protein
MPSIYDHDSVYILITQCLQNSFLLAHETRLCLPPDIVSQMLIGTEETVALDAVMTVERNRRHYAPELVAKGPLMRFFDAALCGKNRVHVVHIKDWHLPSENYDAERRIYGEHCEAGSWGAEPIEGFDKYLQPWKIKTGGEEEARSLEGYHDPNTNNTYYEVLSDTLFDLKPSGPDEPSFLGALFKNLVMKKRGDTKRVYIVMVGVATDIKIQILLTCLRSVFTKIDSLIVSDVLTAAATLERHLAALDYADKVLYCEIVHSLNDLASILNPDHPDDIPASLIQYNVNFRNYRSYFQDKQNMLVYQEQKQIEYIGFTAQRSADVYKQISRTNRILTYFGFGFLGLTLLSSFLKLAYPERVPIEFIALTGGLSMIQLITVFFRNPLQQLQENLTNFVRLRMNLETHSLVVALLRHHFAKPERLNAQLDAAREDEQLNSIQRQIQMIQQLSAKQGESFSAIRIGADGSTSITEETVTEYAPTVASPRLTASSSGNGNSSSSSSAGDSGSVG